MSGTDVLRERIARALWENRYPGVEQAGPLADLALTDADAVIAALGLTEQREQSCTFAFNDDELALHWAPRRRYVTPWGLIEEDG